MEPVIEIPKIEPHTVLHANYINTSDGAGGLLVENDVEIIDQMDVPDDDTVEIELNTVSKRVLFEKYFRIISKDEATTILNTECLLCKNRTIVKGDLENRSRFRKHLKVCILIFLYKK